MQIDVHDFSSLLEFFQNTERTYIAFIIQNFILQLPEGPVGLTVSKDSVSEIPDRVLVNLLFLYPKTFDFHFNNYCYSSLPISCSQQWQNRQK